MIKKTIGIAFAVALLSACANPEAQEKTSMDDVIKMHDKVMGISEHALRNKMKLDTVLKTRMAEPAQALNKKLSDADDAMENWMHKFDPDKTGKSHDEFMAYLSMQKTQLLKVDSQLNAAITASDKYLQSIKNK